MFVKPSTILVSLEAMGRLLLVLFSFLLLGLSVYGQNERQALPVLDTRNGLLQNKVNCLALDSSGFLWVGTETGLFRYDGYRVLPFLKDLNTLNSISNNRVNALIVDTTGRIWIGTSEGLNCYDPRSETMRSYYSGPATTDLKSNDIKSLYLDKSGHIWIGTIGGGLAELSDFDGKGDALFNSHLATESPNSLKTSIITSICEDLHGRLWVGTDAGLYSMLLYDDERSPDKPASFSLFGTELQGDTIFSSDWYVQAITYEEGILWVSDQAGINRISLNQVGTEADQSYRYYSDFATDDLGPLEGPVKSFIRTKDGDFVAGTNEGFYIYDKSSESFVPGVSSALPTLIPIADLGYDRNGNIIVGTESQGVFAIPSHLKIEAEENTKVILEEEIVSAIYNADETWIGTYGNGLIILSDDGIQKGYNSTNEALFKDDWISGIYRISDSRILITTYGESPILEYDLSTKKFLRSKLDVSAFSNKIRRIKIQDPDIYWLSTQDAGLLRVQFDEEEPNVTQFSKSAPDSLFLSDDAVNDIEFLGDRLLIATDNGGLNILDYKSAELSVIGHEPGLENSLSSNVLNSIYVDPDIGICIGTSGGLDVLRIADNSYQISHYSISDGLPSDLVYEIQALNDSILIISTGNGLCALNKGSNLVSALRDPQYSRREFVFQSSHRSASGELFFGSVSGLVSLTKLENESFERASNIVFTQLSINDSIISPLSKLESGVAILDDGINFAQNVSLDHRSNAINIHFSDLNLISEKEPKFKYRLIPYDKGWSFTNATELIFNDIPSGNYTLELGSVNGRTESPKEIKSLKIKVKPAPWFSSLAYGLYTLIALLALYFLYRLLRSRLRLRENLRLQMLEREKSEELNELRNQLFTNISHEFRTPLTLILGPLERLNEELGTEHSDSLNSIKKNAERLLKLINQLLDLSKVESGYMQVYTRPTNANLFITQLSSKYQQGFISRNISFTYSGPKEQKWLAIDPEKLEMILGNVLSNAAKYCPPGGWASLEFSYVNNNLEFEVYDSGPGVPLGDDERIFDRFYMAEKQSGATGSGIGLALAKELCALLGGSISYRRPAEGGSLFKISIPADEVDQLGHRSSNEHKIEIQYPKNASVLLVEDNPEIMELLISIMPREYEVFTADDGSKGLELAKKEIPDAVISDVMMPVMDGVEMLKELKRDLLTSHIPVIFLTAKTDDASRLEGLRSGADNYLEKPFASEELLSLLGNQLNRQEALKARLVGSGADFKMDALPSMDQQFLLKLKETCLSNLANEDFGVKEMAEEMGFSRVHLSRKLKAISDQSPSNFLKEMRLANAANIISNGNGTVSEAAYRSGFANLSYFSKVFKEKYSLSPSDYAKKIKSEKNNY